MSWACPKPVRDMALIANVVLPGGATKPLKLGSIAAMFDAVPGPAAAPAAAFDPSCRLWTWLAISCVVNATVGLPSVSPMTRGYSPGPSPWLLVIVPTMFGSWKLVVPLPPYVVPIRANSGVNC